MRAALAIAVATLVGCSSNSFTDPNGDGTPPGNGDAGAGGEPGGPSSPCAVGLTVTPASAIAGSTTQIVAAVAPVQTRLVTYTWRVVHNGAVITPQAPDGSAMLATSGRIQFATPDPGIYDVSVVLTGAPDGCSAAALPVNVGAANANSQMFRLRILPSDPSVAPPFEKSIVIRGGAAVDLGTTSLDLGNAERFLVTAAGNGVAAYLRLSPVSMPEAVVEGFAVGGIAEVRIAAQPYSVLVVPSSSDLAPRRFPQANPSDLRTLPLDAGTPITGTLRGPGSAPIAGATVQLSIDGVPSSVGVTADDGSFTVHSSLGGSDAVLEVMPPSASNLPRLAASMPAPAIGASLDITYAMNAGPVSLATTRVMRDGAPLRNTAVTLVGSLPVWRVETTTPTSTTPTAVGATGAVRIAARTDGDGALVGVQVPKGPLSAVIAVAPDDLAVVALDATTGAPARLDMPARTSVVTSAVSPDGRVNLQSAMLDLVPTGALAVAGAPELHAVAGADGVFTARVAPGGHYDLRFRDPGGHAAPLIVADREAASIETSYRLPAALVVRGTLRLGGNQPLPGAVVQVLCDACTGLERDRPIAEAVADGVGRFVVSVPDPGTL